MASTITGNAGLVIVRKGTRVYRLAKLLGDGRRQGKGMSRQEIMQRLQFDPAPYCKLYSGFVPVGRGRYTFVGELPV